MRDKIRKIVVQAIAGTTDLTEAIDQLCDLHNVITPKRTLIKKVTKNLNNENTN